MFGDVSTGAEDDLRALTQLARAMVVKWGMSALLGPVDYHAEEERRFNGDPRFSPDTLRAIDDETRRIIGACDVASETLLADHRSQLDALANALLHEETLDAESIKAATGDLGRATELPSRPPAPHLDGADGQRSDSARWLPRARPA